METVQITCRCKDCDYSDKISYTDEYLYCYFWEYEQGMAPNTVYPDDFCSNAKLNKTN